MNTQRCVLYECTKGFCQLIFVLFFKNNISKTVCPFSNLENFNILSDFNISPHIQVMWGKVIEENKWMNSLFEFHKFCDRSMFVALS